MRLDKYLAETFGVSRSRACTLIELGCCKINGVVTLKKNQDVSENISAADAVKCEITLDIPATQPLDVTPENIPLDVRYEDNDLLVVNKPRGMVVHPSAGHSGGTLVNALLYYCGGHGGGLSGINGVERPGILHRIDKDTSGLLLVAKNDNAHMFLSRQIAEHTLGRYYEAVCAGIIKSDSNVIALPMGRSNADRKKNCVRHDGKRAVTHYEVLRRFDGGRDKYTHVRLRLETGRTHQIRVHMAKITHPVAGDAVYGDGKPSWLNGQCLHARKIGFIRPCDGMYIEIESELPKYFTHFLGQLS